MEWNLSRVVRPCLRQAYLDNKSAVLARQGGHDERSSWVIRWLSKEAEAGTGTHLQQVSDERLSRND